MKTIEISIKAEKYYNADAPVITDEMLDWLFLTLPHNNNHIWDKISKLETIDILANTAYNGCNNIHFYITINKKHEIHREFHVNSPLSLQHPQLGFYWKGQHEPELNCLGKPKERWEWLANIAKYGIDCGEEGMNALKKQNSQWDEYHRLEKIEKEEESRKHRYELYLQLKKEFE